MVKETSIMLGKFSKYTFNLGIIFGFVLLTSTLIFLPAYDASASTEVVLEWTPNSEPDLAGYKVFCREQGQSYNYINPSWSGTENYCTIYDLDENKTYCFVARAYDSEGFESGDSEEVCHIPTPIPENQPPTANAGPDQIVDEGRSVTLNGANSTDPDDAIAGYHWTQTEGSPVTLSDPNEPQPRFTAPDVGAAGASLVFELTVVDQRGLENTDSCVVNVAWLNAPPQADAGIDQTVDEGRVVALDGSASLDIDDGIAGYSWVQISGPAVILSDPASSQPTFTALNVGPAGASLTFNLTVTDMGGLQATDSSIVNISWQNETPLAVVAEEYLEVNPGGTVTLDGTGSMDGDDGIVSYHWTQMDGTPVTLSNPASAVTTFTTPETDENGSNLTFKLTVLDAGGLQSTAECSVYVAPTTTESLAPANTPPTADYSFEISSLKVTFTDGSIDSDGTIVSWFWDFGDGTSNTPQNPRHRYRNPGTYTVTLTVTDDGGAVVNSTPKTITVSK
jgi:PKD repeat protein